MNPEPSTLLNRAASEGDFEDLCELISLYQFDCSSINQSLYSAVKKSQSTSDHLRCIEYLLRHSGNPNFKDASGTSLLMTAAWLGQIQLAELLVSCGSSVDDRDKDSRTALMYAVESAYGDNVDVVKFLLEKKAKVNVSDSHGNSALHKAAEMGYLNSLEVLIEYGALVNAENKEKNTPLHIAARNKFEPGIELLVKKKASCKSLNIDGKSPIDLAPDSLKELFEIPETVSVFISDSLEKSTQCKLCKKELVVGICRPCYEFNLAYNNQMAVENRKIIEDYAKEIQELKTKNQELIKANRELSENLHQHKKTLNEKDFELKKKDSELMKALKETKEKIKNSQSESAALLVRLEEALKENESLKEQLINSKNENKRFRNDCEHLRLRLEESQKTESQGKSRKSQKLSYLKPSQIPTVSPPPDEISHFLIELDKWQEEVHQAYSEITNSIKSLIKTCYPASSIELYGSFATRLHLPSSDIDMVIKEVEGDKRETLRNIEKVLKSQSIILSLNFIHSAFVPVIKAKAGLNGKQVQIDITVNDSNHSGLRSLALVSRLLSQSQQIRPIFLIVKHLLSVCNCKEPYNGGLGSYSLFLMVASFMQKRRDSKDLLETLKDFFGFYLNQEVYLAPIVTQDLASENGSLKTESFYDFMRLVVIDPLNSMNNVSFTTDLAKIIDVFNVAAYNLKKSHFCDCFTCACPVYRMIYETGGYFGAKFR